MECLKSKDEEPFTVTSVKHSLTGSKGLKENKAEIQDSYGNRYKENGLVRRNGLVTKFHLAFYFVASFVNHDLCPRYALYHHTG